MGSRLAALYDRYIQSPFAIGWPQISVSCCAVRMKCRTGVVRRMISSTAFGMRSGCSVEDNSASTHDKAHSECIFRGDSTDLRIAESYMGYGGSLLE